MSKYTTQVRYICETYAGLAESVGYNQVNDVVRQAYPTIFDSELPLFKPEYAAVLYPKILRHYYTREIGFETVGLWKLHLNNRLYEILPYYNQLYTSAEIEFDPFNNIDIVKTIVRDGNDNTTATRKSDKGLQNELTQKTTQAFSRTPQGTLADIENLSYLSEGTIDSFTANSQSTENYSDNSNTDRGYNETVSETTKGKTSMQSYTSALLELRKTYLNIDLSIIEELRDLFITMW